MRSVDPLNLVLTACIAACVTSSAAATEGRSRADDPSPIAAPGTVDGIWSRIPGFTPPANFYEPLVSAYDPEARVLYTVFPRDGSCWKLDLDEQNWTELVLEGPRPPFRRWTAVALDPRRSRLYMFGGENGQFGLRGDLWELQLGTTSQWRQLPSGGQAPTPRYGHQLRYDSVRDRLVLFGGAALNDVYSLALGENPTWTRLIALGVQPPATSDFGAALDETGQRLILVTGRVGQVVPPTETWILSLAGVPQWTRVPTTVPLPGPREGHGVAYDAGQDRVLVFGGWNRVGGGRVYDDTWALPLSGTPAWSEVQVAARPPGRWNHGIFHDPSQNGVLIHGGEWGNDQPGQVHLDCWLLPFSGSASWRSVAGPPTQRNQHVAAFDSTRSRMLVFGGHDRIAPFADSWSFALEGVPWWTALATPGERPMPREGAAWVHDPVANRLVMFGGRSSSEHPTDVWALKLDGVHHWERLPSGAGPQGRTNHAAVYDPIGHRMIIMGGGVSYLEFCGGYRVVEYAMGDMWALSLNTYEWEFLEHIGGGWLGSGLSCVYDRHRTRLIIYGGRSEALEYCGTDCCILRRQFMSSTLEYDLATGLFQTIATAAHGPAPRADHSAIYDPLRQRMVVLGGETAQGQSSELWALSLSGSATWTRLDPSGDAPPAIWSHSAVYDVRSDAMWVYVASQVWRLQWNEPLWSVGVDLRPGQGADPLNPAARGALPIAILSDDTFDAASLDPSTVLVSGAPVKANGNGSWLANLKDLNHDERDDLLVHVDADLLELELGDNRVVVTGRTREGPRIEGHDEVRIVGGPNGERHFAGSAQDDPALEAGMALTLLSVAWDTRRAGPIVRLSGSAPNQVRMVLFDALGRRVAQKSEAFGPGTHEFVLSPAREVHPGIYWIRVEHLRGSVVRRVVALR